LGGNVRYVSGANTYTHLTDEDLKKAYEEFLVTKEADHE
jgi:hypothetical protein